MSTAAAPAPAPALAVRGLQTESPAVQVYALDLFKLYLLMYVPVMTCQNSSNLKSLQEYNSELWLGDCIDPVEWYITSQNSLVHAAPVIPG